ncbi:MAG: hypothetical protein WC506_06680 [Candidatus Micrarchaeia archaeon]
MNENLEKFLVLLLVLLIAFIVLSQGCTSQPQGEKGANWQADGNRDFSGNRTGALDDSQRQAMQQALGQACNGKSAGDSCAADSGRFNMTGTCQNLNGSLLCARNRTGFLGQRPSGQ